MQWLSITRRCPGMTYREKHLLAFQGVAEWLTVLPSKNTPNLPINREYLDFQGLCYIMRHQRTILFIIHTLLPVLKADIPKLLPLAWIINWMRLKSPRAVKDVTYTKLTTSLWLNNAARSRTGNGSPSHSLSSQRFMWAFLEYLCISPHLQGRPFLILLIWSCGAIIALGITAQALILSSIWNREITPPPPPVFVSIRFYFPPLPQNGKTDQTVMYVNVCLAFNGVQI